MFLAKNIEISRDGPFSCPVQTVIVFTSEIYLDIETEELGRFDHLFAHEDVDLLVGTFTDLPAVSELRSGEGFDYKLFEPC